MSFTEAAAADAVETPVSQTVTDSADVSKALTPTGSAAPTAYAPPSAYTSDEDAEGEFTTRDQKWPRLNLAQKTGDLSDDFEFGELVLEKAQAIGSSEKPINVVVLQIQKLYQEVLPWDSGQKPRLFNTAEEVGAAGLSLDYYAPKKAAELLNVVFWVPTPEGVDAPHLFPIEGPNGFGTVAKFTAARTAYGTVGKTLIRAKKTFCSPEKGGFVNMEWSLSVTLEKKNGNSWALPHLTPVGKTDEKLADFLRALKSA